ncbi:hypothetical protein [Pseudonocardia sp. ICBG601]|uniref:phage tail tube protein n=1 Tax=Pseudonocardia sp. ICBG601 TaxID=2846759 RepID=UPI001CF6F5E6|nr:hypothetical protein [Pseudonocardia sp. ICBG601]
MADTDLLTLKRAKAGNIRKVLDAVVAVAPMSAPVPETFTVAGALQELPPEYRTIGWVSKKDGYKWSRDTDSSDIESHGSVEPTRRDITKDVTGLAMTAQETSRLTLELSNNVDLSEARLVDGELSYTRQVAPSTRYWRLIAIGIDGSGSDAFYVINVLPRATISEYGELTWSDEDALTYPLTWSATVDQDLKYSFRQVLAGPGFESRAADMDFSGAVAVA